MAAPKGMPKPEGSGRKKGVRNKLTDDLKSMVFGALHAGGGQAFLERQMDENPVAFMSLLGKFVPRDINATVGFNESLAERLANARKLLKND